MLFLEGLHGLSMRQEAFFDMHVQQAQDLTLSVACICIMQRGEGHLAPVRLVFLDLEQLRRMQNFTRHELLELERPT